MQKRWINKNRKTIKKVFIHKNERCQGKNEILCKTQEHNKSNGGFFHTTCVTKMCDVGRTHT